VLKGVKEIELIEEAIILGEELVGNIAEVVVDIADVEGEGVE